GSPAATRGTAPSNAQNTIRIDHRETRNEPITSECAAPAQYGARRSSSSPALRGARGLVGSGFDGRRTTGFLGAGASLCGELPSLGDGLVDPTTGSGASGTTVLGRRRSGAAGSDSSTGCARGDSPGRADDTDGTLVDALSLPFEARGAEPVHQNTAMLTTTAAPAAAPRRAEREPFVGSPGTDDAVPAPCDSGSTR